MKIFAKYSLKLPVIAGIASGLYPALFYNYKNYTLVNSWEHHLYFLFVFILLPIAVFTVAVNLFNNKKLVKYKKYVLPFLNITFFLFFLKICLYAGVQRKIIVGILLIAVIVAYFLYHHLKKILVLQFLIALVGLVSLLFKLYSYSTISNDWKIQPDAIAEVQFKKTPNVYYIQADGYVNFSEMDKGFYQYDNSPFKSYLEQNGFKNYANFRSNYPTTLESNASTFMMKHHFFNNSLITGEIYNSRNTIISKNTVLDVFNNNGYKTYFVSETPYMLLNRPKMGYDVSNIAYSEIAYLNNGIGKRRDIVEPVLNLVSQEINSPKFFFVQILKPWHIHSRKRHTLYKEKERLAWLESLEEANVILKELVSEILKKDPDALLIITADHGGYVGMDYTDQTIAKSQNRDFIYSIFSSQLSIRWPNNEAPTYDAHFASSVNLFRILFSYLSNNEAYLEYLQEDSSYTIIREGAPEGIYKYIDHDGHIVFEGINATD